MLTRDDLRLLASGLDHPEGVALGPDGLVYAGGERGEIYRIDPATRTFEQIADLGGFVLGLCLDAAGAIYACNADQGAVIRFDPHDGSQEVWCQAADGQRLRTPNWPAFTRDGSMIVSDSGSDDQTATGTVVRIPPGGGDGEVLDLPALWFPNGLAIAPNDSILLVESFRPRLSRIDTRGISTVCELPGVVPDGVALAADGSVFVSCYYPFRILHVTCCPATSELLIDDPLGTRLIMPTNVCFFGDDLARLAIASLGGSDIMELTSPVPGLPLNFPA